MNDETIIDQNEVKNEPLKDEAVGNEETVLTDEQNAPANEEATNKKKKKGLKTAGIAGAAGVVGAAIGVLTPVNVFPVASEIEGEDISNGIETEPAPSSSAHLQGHDMEVATSVNDSMNFSQAFAAARHEVGPGGLFVWHGHTYGTYYANEWEAMSPEEHDQYWADVYHTTSHIEYESQTDQNQQDDDVNHGEDNNQTEENNQAENNQTENNQAENNQTENNQAENNQAENNQTENNQAENNQTEVNNQTAENNQGGESNEGLAEEDIDGASPLELHEEDVLGVADVDEDGNIDTVVADVNHNDIPDLILDSNNNGEFDTLILDPENVDVDENGQLVVEGGEQQDIVGIELMPTEEIPTGETLVLNESDVYAAMDSDDNGQIDALVVDANGNELPDLVVDTVGDGNMDTLILDAIDENGEISLNEDNVSSIDGVVITPEQDLDIEPDYIAENQDVDDLADLTPDPDVTIDNNMGMDDFIA